MWCVLQLCTFWQFCSLLVWQMWCDVKVDHLPSYPYVPNHQLCSESSPWEAICLMLDQFGADLHKFYSCFCNGSEFVCEDHKINQSPLCHQSVTSVSSLFSRLASRTLELKILAQFWNLKDVNTLCSPFCFRRLLWVRTEMMSDNHDFYSQFESSRLSDILVDY